MAACEKCWEDAWYRSQFVNPIKSQPEHYAELLEERKDNPCSPREAAGQFWDEEHQCNRLDLPKVD